MESQQKILVVDDSPENIDVIVGLLGQHYEVIAATNGKMALKIASMKPPDLILLDILMPEIDGYEVCEILKDSPLTSDIPVIFLTAKTSLDDIVRGFRSGAVDYISKPFFPEEMMARVNTHLTMRRQKIQLFESEKIASMTRIFEKFVPKQFLSRIAKDGIENIELGKAESDIITILFSDIRSFTTFSENMVPQNLLQLLNTYFSLMDQIIRKHNGFVDKFIGDGIMALFTRDNATAAEVASDAISSAIAMQKAVMPLHTNQQNEQFPPISIGIGIHSGPAIIGITGSEQRMASTVLGDSVNIASRLEGLTKTYGAKILVSSETIGMLGKRPNFNFREIDVVKVKGKTKTTKIYEVYDCDSPDRQILKNKTSPYISEGIYFRDNDELNDAAEVFQKAAEIDPDDRVLQHHLAACLSLRDSG
ncbi:MAG: response regulator [SAR324 cluster bacterium]|nr:response regulator [SAR324 cluster bacterium]